MNYFNQCQSLEEANEKLAKLEAYYNMRLEECWSLKKELKESEASEDIKTIINSHWNIRINEISHFLRILKYGWA